MKVIKGGKNDSNSNQSEFKEQLAKNLEGLKLNDLDGVKCEKCENPTFNQVFLLRKISAPLSFLFLPIDIL